MPRCADRGGVPGVPLKAVKLAWKPPRAGARAVVRAADLPGATGRYLNVAQDVPLKPAAADRALARRVWAQAAELTGLTGRLAPADGPGVT